MRGKAMKAKEKKEKWIVPQGLEWTVEDFRSVCDILSKAPRKTPLMVMGDTGVGKSLFVERFEDHFKKKNPDASGPRVNVAAIPETLIESELFGHEKGAFTGANRKRPGLVENKDLLVLEEIGELKSHVQAKLLTFIEDGIFYPVGAREPKKAGDIQIIGTTNKEEDDFRADFYHRFFHFKVPPLYRRRSDVLHYFAHFSPDTFRELRPWEAMTLLCHNWPGNVREIETFALEVELEKARRLDRSVNSRRTPFLDAAIGTQTGLAWDWCPKFRNSLKMNGVDVDCLESNLNRFGLGLDNTSKKNLFKNVTPKEICFKLDDGLLFFAGLFWKSRAANVNLLAERGGDQIPVLPPLFLLGENTGTEAKKLEEKAEKLVRDCLQYIGKKAAGEIPAGASVDELLKAVGVTVIDPIPLKGATDATGAAGSGGKPKTEADVLRHYYKDLLEQLRGNVSNVAKLAGINRSNLYDRLKNLDIDVTVYRHS
jgi:DNA-binding NtrC family response regulator